MKSNAIFIFTSFLIASSIGVNLVSCTKKNPSKAGSRFLASTPSENLICDDLFTAACVNPDGTLKDLTEELRAETNEMIEVAQNKALKAMGFDSLEDAYLDRIQKAGGFEVGPQESGANFNLGLGVASCDESPISGNSQSRHTNLIIDYYSDNLSEYILHVAENCSAAEDSILSSESKSICANQLRLRTEVSNIMRLPANQRKEKARNFVNDNNVILDSSAPDSANNICYHAEYIQNLRLDEIDSKLRLEIQTSRPFVEHVIDHFYSPENIKQANEHFTNSRRHLQNIYNEINPNSPNEKTFQTSMSNLRLKILEKPSATDYTRNANGTFVLKENSTYIEGDHETYQSVFSDPRLSYFRDNNAAYFSPAEISALGTEYKDLGHISMRPTLWAQLQSNPTLFYSILAHENGHKFSPNISSYEGFGDITEKFDDLFTCFSQSESIAMTEEMKTEVIADYMAAEILARKLAEEPDLNRRRELLIQSQSNLCVTESELLSVGYFARPNDGYPPNNHRCSGIFGANQNIRNLIGCKGDSPNYKSCGLDLSLDSSSGPSTNPATGSSVEEVGTE